MMVGAYIFAAHTLTIDIILLDPYCVHAVA